jgi:hypothetical protein
VVLRAHAAGRDRSRPTCDARHADAALGQVHLAADQRPVVAEALAAVVAGEHDQRVIAQARGVEGIEHAANTFVHLADHLVIDVDRAAVVVRQRRAADLWLGPAASRLPRPVRRGVVQAEQERRSVGLTVPSDDAPSPAAAEMAELLSVQAPRTTLSRA